MKEPPETRMESPDAKLELAFIDEYLRERGLDRSKLVGLSEADRKAVLTQASLHAATRLAEVESRAHYVHEIHDEH